MLRTSSAAEPSTAPGEPVLAAPDEAQPASASATGLVPARPVSAPPATSRPAGDIRPAPTGTEPPAQPTPPPAATSASPSDTTPAQPAAAPGAATPPAETPDTTTPPAETPDTTTPPAETPDTATPPAETPDAAMPPSATPLGAQTPMTEAEATTASRTADTGAGERSTAGPRAAEPGATGPGGPSPRAADASAGAPSTAGPRAAEGSTTSLSAAGPSTTGTGGGGTRDAGRQNAAQGDPEQVLASYRWRLDPATLREIVAEPDEFRTIRRRLTEKLGAAVDNKSRARLLSLRAVVSRILGELDDALADGRLALTYAEATGELRRTAVAQARLAHVLRWRGEFVEADRLFAEANSTELPERLRAVLHEHSGRSCYDQGRLMEACHHFERALDLRGTEDPELQARIRLSLDAVAERVAETGFGPYPRTREEVLESDRPPAPARDGDLWGFAGPDGDMVIAAEYAEAQPFRDGLAWVRRPETERWSLVDRTGATVLEASYPVVRSFSDGLAWVSDGGDAGWVAIDATGEVVVPHGFADVRPFRRGVAVVRRDGWGAVDRNGRIVVPTRHHGFVTVLADGRYVEGFTEEGLAVVDVAGRRGVVNRTGRVLVPPTHPALVIHPVAFLVGDGTGRWGALDRRGEPLIEPVHRDRDEVVAEIERLLVDTSPVL
ncbi:WG repeat-containing protein [Micromonospora sp. MSM11]|nr:WG repeat-containing protein [Micromonospora sp. MSM11]MCL7457869.1 WG repeat-containing protein [Micromonospora sp. MSM11]